MNAADLPFPPLLTLKPVPNALATCPVGPEAPAGGMLTVNKGALPTPVLPVTEKSGVVCVAWSEIQTGLPFANETPQGFTRLGVGRRCEPRYIRNKVGLLELRLGGPAAGA